MGNRRAYAEKGQKGTGETHNQPLQGLGRAEGYFYLIWGSATLLTSLLVYILRSALTNYSAAKLWMLVPTLGLVGSVYLIRRSRAHRTLFAHHHRSISQSWMIMGPSIGITTLLIPDPLPVQLLLVGCAVAINGVILQWRMLKWMGILGIALSVVLQFTAHPLRDLLFGLFTFTIMGTPGAYLLKGKERHTAAFPKAKPRG